jgi:hypothetical protein
MSEKLTSINVSHTKFCITKFDGDKNMWPTFANEIGRALMANGKCLENGVTYCTTIFPKDAYGERILPDEY